MAVLNMRAIIEVTQVVQLIFSQVMEMRLKDPKEVPADFVAEEVLIHIKVDLAQQVINNHQGFSLYITDFVKFMDLLVIKEAGKLVNLLGLVLHYLVVFLPTTNIIYIY